MRALLETESIDEIHEKQVNQELSDQSSSGELLSFVPKSYSLTTDGRLETVVIYGLQERNSPEKHHVFILEVTRENVKAPTYVFRTYKEFCELDLKLHTIVDHPSSVDRFSENVF